MRAQVGLVTSLLLVTATALHSQVPAPPAGYVVSSWTTANGLPQGDITGLAVDRAGYLWIGSSIGLARFDGDSFVPWPREAAPREIVVRGIVTDRNGTPWVATADDGIFLLDSAGTLVTMTTPAPARPRSVALAAGDSIWISHFGEVNLHAAGTWRTVPSLGAVSPAGEVEAMLSDGRGATWIGGRKGLIRMAPDGAAQPVAGIHCVDIVAQDADVPGDVWVGTCGSGISHVTADLRAETLVRERGAAPALSLLAENGGILWVGDGKGLSRYEVSWDEGPRGRLVYNSPLNLERAGVVQLLHGRDGSIWAGTSGAGIRLVSPIRVGRITQADGLPQRALHHLAPDGAGGLWLGGGCGYLAHWNGERITTHRSPVVGIDTTCIRGLLRDRQGNLWMGEAGAIAMIGPSGFASRKEWLAEDRVVDVSPLLEDRRGRIWIGTSSGRVGIAHTGSPPDFLPAGTLPAEKVWSIVEDSIGVWIGQEGEMAHLVDGRLVERLTETNGMPPGPVRGLYFDQQHALWIVSYGGGIARYQPGKGIQRLPRRGRRFEQFLSAIRVDREGRYWFLGDGGLTMVEAADLRAAIDSQRPLRSAVDLGLADGVPEGNGGYPNAWVDTMANRLWVATVDGAVAVDMARIPFDTIMPGLRIDAVRVDDHPHEAGARLVVPPRAADFDIRFTAPSYGERSDLRFRYRLRGHDQGWVENGTSRVAHYGSLAPGDYTFEVIARGRDGRESAPLVLPVEILPAWWETDVARAIFLVALLALLWFLYRLVTENLRDRAAALQHEIVERTRAEAQAAAAASDLAHVSRLATAGELAASIAHELNQPLAAVVGNAQTARRLANAQKNAALTDLLDAIVAQSNRAADVIRTLRAFVVKRRAAEQRVPVDVVVQGTLRLLRQELSARGIAVRVLDEQFEGATVLGDPVQLQQVLVNLLLNAADAMEHLDAYSRQVTVLIRRDDGATVRVAVSDVGRGLSPEMLSRVFDPFFTTKESGLGLGLSLSRSIVESHGGRLWAESPDGNGCTFHVVLPVAA